MMELFVIISRPSGCLHQESLSSSDLKAQKFCCGYPSSICMEGKSGANECRGLPKSAAHMTCEQTSEKSIVSPQVGPTKLLSSCQSPLALRLLYQHCATRAATYSANVRRLSAFCTTKQRPARHVFSLSLSLRSCLCRCPL